MKIGVMVESFRLGLEGGLEAAVELKVDGIQMYAVRGETHPDNMNSAARAALRRRLADLGMEMAAAWFPVAARPNRPLVLAGQVDFSPGRGPREDRLNPKSVTLYAA